MQHLCNPVVLTAPTRRSGGGNLESLEPAFRSTSNAVSEDARAAPTVTEWW